MPQHRLFRIAGSFAIVVVAYWVYTLIAVPLIEPTADANQTQQLTEAERQSIAIQRDYDLEELRPLFPPDTWESKPQKILKYGQIRLLLQKIPELEKGCSYTIKPCTLVYTPLEPADNSAERIRRSVVLQAPEGAVLEFDKALDLLRGQSGGFVRGELRGQVTIRSAGKEPGPEDDMFVVTRNIQLTNDRVWTTEPVEFRLGQSCGRGVDMQLVLLHNDKQSGGRPPSPAGVEKIEIRRLERLHLEFPDSKTGQPVAIEVSARGPFRFNLVERLAKLQDQVDVLRLHPNGPSDQLNCESLSIYFARRRSQPQESTAGASQPADAVGLSDLEPRRIEARGNPVVVRAPQQEFQGQVQEFEGRGERLEYDLSDGQIFLAGTPEASLRLGTREIHAPSLQYQPAEGQPLGQAVAPGPGWLRGQVGQRPDQQFVVRWTEQLQLRPDPQGQSAISLTGGASVESPGYGCLTAREIHLWLLALPAAAGPGERVRPDRMRAIQQVHLDSPRISGNLEQLDVWFKEPDATQLAAGREKAAQTGLLAQVQSQFEQAQLAMQVAQGFSGANQAPRPGSAGPGPAPPPGGQEGLPVDGSHFEVTANSLQTLVFVQGEDMDPSQMTLEGDVRVTETPTGQPGHRPVILTGDQIRVFDAKQPYAAVTVVGQPAHFEGQGLAMTGSNINIHRGQNRLWMEGPGEMTRTIDQDLEGKPIEGGGSLAIQWQQKMDFNGKVASFTGAVSANAQGQQLQTELLEVTFQHRILFANVKGQPAPVVETLACQSGVRMLVRTFDASGQVSLMEMRIPDLSINNISGELVAHGPGWMTSIRRGGSGLQLPGGPVATEEKKEAKDQLNYLNVHFQRGITGNVHQRILKFQQQIRAIYGPVASWEQTLDPNDPNGPKPGATALESDELTVAQVPLPTDPRRMSVNLATQGNTKVQGTTETGGTFTALAHRMLYDQAKDQLILDWDGRNYAELFYQKNVGGQPYHEVAQKILFRPSTWDLQIEGHRFTELQAPPAKP